MAVVSSRTKREYRGRRPLVVVVVEDVVVVARRARCVWARCATHREDDDDGDDDDARAMRVFHDDDDDGSTIERGQGTRTTRTTTTVRWDGWVTDDDGSSVHPSSVQLSIGDRGVEPPDRARAWRGWNGADVGPVVDPDAKDERRARSWRGRGMRGYANGWPSESDPHPSRRAGCFICLSTDDGPSGRRRPRRRADERNARVNEKKRMTE